MGAEGARMATSLSLRPVDREKLCDDRQRLSLFIDLGPEYFTDTLVFYLLSNKRRGSFENVGIA